MANFYSLKVAGIRSLTPNSVAVTFEVPEVLNKTFSFTPGQYITIKKEIDGKELRRAYSISSSTKDRNITIGIKRVDHGGFSDYANTKLAVNDALEVMPPEGRFLFNSSEDTKNIVAFAAGSGITPIMSIARAVLDANSSNKFVLMYGNQSFEQTMFYSDLLKLQEEYTNRFFLYIVLSRTQEEDALFGRIDNAKVNYLLKNKHRDEQFDDYYICGPEPMIHLVQASLEEKGIAKDSVHFELFTTTEDEEQIQTPSNGQTQLSVLLDDEEFSLTMDKKTAVLDAVLKADIDAPYSCQGGICSTCIARITEGKAEMAKNQILTDSEIAEGFVLTCQAHPTTQILKIDYDDV